MSSVINVDGQPPPLFDRATKALLKQDDLVKRCAWLELNFWCIVWANDCSVVSKRAGIKWLRRYLTVGLVFVGILLIDFVDVVHRHYGCYPSDYDIWQLNLGTCDFAGAPILSSPIYVPFSFATVPALQWILWAIFIGMILLSLGLHIYNARHFVKDLEVDIIANERNLYATVRSHLGPGTSLHAVMSYLSVAGHHQKNGPKIAAVPLPPCLALKRVARLFRTDLFGAYLGTSQFILRNWKLFALVWFNNIVGLVNFLCFYFLVYPDWKESCCRPPELADARYGSCTDNNAPISHDPARRLCTPFTFSIGMWIWIFIHIANFILSFALHLHAYSTCQKRLEISVRQYLLDLAQHIDTTPELQANLKKGLHDLQGRQISKATLAVFNDFDQYHINKRNRG